MCVVSIPVLVQADNDRPIQVGQLPTKAQAFITKYFRNHKVALAKMESGLFYKSYNVIFTNGDKLEFDRSGNWTEIQCERSEVPVGAVPAEIRAYVEEYYPGAKILQIERDGKEYEVELSNHWEITFDRRFQVIDIDD